MSLQLSKVSLVLGRELMLLAPPVRLSRVPEYRCFCMGPRSWRCTFQSEALRCMLILVPVHEHFFYNTNKEFLNQRLQKIVVIALRG